ncbi:hypothetical protein [Kocuria rosea]|uniref:hypothetical protein n=1 Tax=Kocuria rosea TaxID=1275 RepID=UPI000F6BE059|nr:hypothetical protein [Kocuria rosea]MEB2528519.1 hypothetical protein [Kocuria rosea]MEB2619389.1 hypothetical protein [Kocuria rosea]QCY31744.1 hypothetical protein EQG70_01765 [Kocuria rosea]TQN39168.1 hypothetical protein FHX38_1006 [Kocuria rosea]VEI51807.1 Uncharacterised protein [Kocuria rosea]
MREDLTAACRLLGVIQRVVLREQLRRAEVLLDPAETVQVLAPGWWRCQRTLVVVTTSRLLLVRRELGCFTRDQVTYPLRGIGTLRVQACPPEGVRFRVSMGLDLEEFSVTRHGDLVEHALRGARS